MNGISIVMPCDNRTDLLMASLGAYSDHMISDVEFVIVSRTLEPFTVDGLNLKFVRYEWHGDNWNPALALNVGVINASYYNILITCPEVRPETHVLEQLSALPRGNYVCQVFDLRQDGSIDHSLVNSGYRWQTPGFYFAAMFQAEDVAAINGWDMDLMRGFAFDDDDFGARFVRAGLTHEMRDEIQCSHQWHPRGHCGGVAFERNRRVFTQNNENGVTACARGMDEVRAASPNFDEFN